MAFFCLNIYHTIANDSADTEPNALKQKKQQQFLHHAPFVLVSWKNGGKWKKELSHNTEEQ